MGAGLHRHRPPPGAIGAHQTIAARRMHQQTAGWEIRAFYKLHQVFNVYIVEIIPTIQHQVNCRGHLPQVVGRNAGRHPNGDPYRTVHQQIGNR